MGELREVANVGASVLARADQQNILSFVYLCVFVVPAFELPSTTKHTKGHNEVFHLASRRSGKDTRAYIGGHRLEKNAARPYCTESCFGCTVAADGRLRT